MKLLLLTVVLISTQCFGQLSSKERVKIDSLKKVVATAGNDTIVISALKSWDDIIYKSDSDLDLKLNLLIDSVSTRNLQQEISKKERAYFLKSKGFSTGNLGLIYNSLGDNTTAMDYLNESLEIKKALKDTKSAARTLNNIGSIYHEQGIYKKAIQYYSKALEIHEKEGNNRGIAGALNNIAIIHRYQGNYETALEFYERSLAIKLEEKDSTAIAVAYLNMGTLYNEMKSFEKAREITIKSLEISEKTGNRRNIALANVNLGSIYHEQKDLPNALKFYLKGFTIQENIGDNKKVAETAVYLSRAYFDTGNIEKAKSYGERALKLSYVNDVLQVSEQASEILYSIYKKTGEMGKALEMLELNIKLKDQIDSEENKKEVIRQEFKYYYEKQAIADSTRAAEAAKVKDARLAAEIAKKKQHKLEAKQQEQQKYCLFGGLLLTLLFAGFIFNRFKHTRKQKALIEEQKKEVDQAYDELGQEKEKSDALLLNILPEEVAEELKSQGKSTPKHYKQVTVLFTDFKGFTKVAADISPQDLVKTLNECFSAFDTIIEKHRLEKIKTIGDAYMCAGGVPRENTTNAGDAVEAACEMMAWVEGWNEKRRQKDLPVWEVRIGIHTGELVAGVIGSKKFAYDVWGDAVNVASRMESSGEPGKINISTATNDLVLGAFKTEFRGEIEVKNRGYIGMYYVCT